MKKCDVIVVGAGPVGLLAAVELGLGRARVLLLERLPAPSLVSKALGIGPLGVEALQRRGMAAAVDEAEAHAIAAMQSFMGAAKMGAATPGRAPFSGHFAGLMIPGNQQAEPGRRSRPIDQQAAETMLTIRAAHLGIEVRRGCEVTGLEQLEGEVVVRLTSSAGEFRASGTYLVGCDGGRSAIRKLAGFDFPGTPATMTMFTAICDLDHADRLGSGGFRLTPHGMVFYGPFPRRLGILDFSGPPQNREAPVTREEVESVLRRVSGADVRVAAMESAGRWADNTRLVDSYRRGRVFLAGDAAHIHSPFGGQGMGLGLTDAANLGWKLAAVVRGALPETLLDTYTAERRPAAEAVLTNTLAQAAIMQPDPRSAALRGVVADLLRLADGGRFFGDMVRGLSLRYDLGPAPDIVGRLAADRPVGSGDAASLYALMQDGCGVFLDASPGGHLSARVLAATNSVRCGTITPGPSLLLRPDACVAWAGEEDGAGLSEALHRWFVAPSPQPGSERL